MKGMLLVCSALLFIGMANLPIGYYTFLRIVVTIGSVAVCIAELENGFSFWFLIFGVIAILFNPLIPIYLNSKSVWAPLDVVAALCFILKIFTSTAKTT